VASRTGANSRGNWSFRWATQCKSPSTSAFSCSRLLLPPLRALWARRSSRRTRQTLGSPPTRQARGPGAGGVGLLVKGGQLGVAQEGGPQGPGVGRRQAQVLGVAGAADQNLHGPRIPFRDPPSISPLNGAMTMGHFLLPRPIARRPAQQSRSAARGVSTGVTSRRTGGRARQVGQAFAAHEPRPSDPGLVLASWVKGLSHSRSKDTPAVLSESTLEVK